MNRIDQLFQTGRKAFIAYATAGFPSIAATAQVLDVLVENGADLIELGYPFSDPTADGAVIQVTSFQALQRGLVHADYLKLLADFRRRHPQVPVVVFSYYNPIFFHGVAAFADAIQAAGADGVLIVDLPLEEQEEVLPLLRARGLHLIQLLTPTTPEARARAILMHAGGFVYQVSLRGVTGARREIGAEALALVQRTKALTALPVALGFGVARGEQAAAIAPLADGVIVGSALMQVLVDHEHDFVAPLAALTRELAVATHGPQG